MSKLDNPSWTDAPLTRRTLLGALPGALLLLSQGFGSRALAQVPPSYSDLAEELRTRNIRIQSGEALPGNDDFKEFILTQGTKTFGRLITLETAGNGYFDQIVCDGDHPEDFQTRSRQYELDHPGTEVVLQVAGGFSCRGDGCQSTNPREWEPDGFLTHRGESIGWGKPNSKYGGIVALDPTRSPQILPIENLEALGKNADVFQAFRLVENGLPQHFRPGPSMPRRALIERFYMDHSGATQNQWAILNVDEPMDLSEFGDFLVRGLGVRNAALLDTGSHALGWLKYQNGNPRYLLAPEATVPAMPNFTSLLVGVRRK